MQSKIISADPPSVLEQKHNDSLIAWCATCIEPLEESKRRQQVLQRLDHITKMWIRSTMITEYRVPAHEAEQVESRIFATGSYRYNVHTSGSDIDLVLIAPDKITRRHFFTSLVERLRSESWIRNIIPTEDAIVPIIAMECDGIDVDLSFGAIKRTKVPEKLDDDLIRGLDDSAMRSCNAVRVAQLIIDLVPDINTFRQALRFVKAWAKARGIYSSKFGFPTGIGWAILTAFVCQCYPKQNPAGVVCRFFQTYKSWFRADQTNRPIFLTESHMPRNPIGKSWDPRTDRRDARALFPVLTPANPYGNACYNVTKTTLRILCDEFRRGHEMLQAALARPPLADQPFGVWGALLASSKEEFLTAHKHYLHVRIATTTPQSYQRYVEAVEAKIRHLWEEQRHNTGRALECFPQVRVHVWSTRFEDPEQTALLKQLLAADKARSAKNASVPGNATAAAVTTTASGSTSSGGATTAQAPLDASTAPVDDASAVAALSAALAPGAPLEFTAHYFIGLEMLSTPQQQQTGQRPQPVDLDGVVKAFTSFIIQQKEFIPGVTKAPHIAVITPAKMPPWVVSKKHKRDEAADPPPPPPGEVSSEVAAAASAATAAGATAAVPSSSSSSAPASSLGAGTSVAAGSGGSAPAAVQQESMTAAPTVSAVDEALGLDF